MSRTPLENGQLVWVTLNAVPALLARHVVERRPPVRGVAVADHRDRRPSPSPSAPRTRRSGCRRGARSPCRDGSAPCAPRSASARPCSAAAGCCTACAGSRAAAPKHFGFEARICCEARSAAATSPRMCDIAPGGHDQHHARPRGGGGERPAPAARGQEAPGAHRVLDQHLRQRRGEEREREDHHARLRVQAAVDHERREDQQRPVPEVDRVGDVAEVLDRRQLEHRRRRPAPRRRARPRSRPARPAPGSERGVAGERRVLGEEERGEQDRERCRPTTARRARSPASARSGAAARAGRRAPNSQARVGVMK